MPAVSFPATPAATHGVARPTSADWAYELSQIWGRQQARMDKRIETIARALDELADDRLETVDPERRWKAVRAAHMLAGSLGVFGLYDASAAARRIELGLTDACVSADAAALTGQLERLRDEVRRGPSASSAPEPDVAGKAAPAAPTR